MQQVKQQQAVNFKRKVHLHHSLLSSDAFLLPLQAKVSLSTVSFPQIFWKGSTNFISSFQEKEALRSPSTPSLQTQKNIFSLPTGQADHCVHGQEHMGGTWPWILPDIQGHLKFSGKSVPESHHLIGKNLFLVASLNPSHPPLTCQCTFW